MIFFEKKTKNIAFCVFIYCSGILFAIDRQYFIAKRMYAAYLLRDEKRFEPLGASPCKGISRHLPHLRFEREATHNARSRGTRRFVLK
jgi:hypothetical protein